MSWLVLHVADKQEVRLLGENKGIRGLWGEGAYFCVFVYLFFFYMCQSVFVQAHDNVSKRVYS